MAEINDRIKERRLAAGKTLLEVAEYLGVKEATAQRYEARLVCFARSALTKKGTIKKWHKLP